MDRNSTTAPEAAAVLAGEHTPEQLEVAIRAQADLIEFHHICGRMALAREACALVKRLVAMRTPETVASMERERGLV